MKKTAKMFFTLLITSYFLKPAMAQDLAPNGVRDDKFEIMQQVVRLMNASFYDSSEVMIIKELFNKENILTAEEQYFFLCYESEIMYYNALFDLGLASAQNALEIARELGNDTLIGSALNLAGLQYMHLKRYPEARNYFSESANLLPESTDKRFFSQRYHALANLGETYLYLNQPDSAVFYSELAVADALQQNVSRGASFAYWSLAEGELMRNNITLAKQAALKAFEIIDTHQVLDVRVFMSMTMVKIYLAENNLDSAMYHWEQGEWYTFNTDASDFTKHTYLDFLVQKSLELKLPEKAYLYLNQLYDMRTKTASKQEEQRLYILESLYKGKEELTESLLRSKVQQAEIKLRGIIVTVLILLLIIGGIAIYLIFKNVKNKQRLARLSYRNQLMQQEQKLELAALENRIKAINAERNRIASDLHDDIGAGLSSIHIYGNVALKRNDEQNRFEMLNRITLTSQSLMERMSDIIWSINPENEKLHDLILRIKSFAVDILLPLQIDVKYHFDDEQTQLTLNVLARKNIFLTLKEAINNIAKYSQATQVDIKFFIKNDLLSCEIRDNGIGYDKLNTTPGNGQINMKRRIESLKGEILCVSELGNGTVVKIALKMANIRD